DRNFLIQRVNRILEGIEEDYEHGGAQQVPALTSKQFATLTIDELIKTMGPAWGGYQRLRVAETTDDLVLIVTRAAGFSEASDEFLGIRYLVRAWRNENFAPRRAGKQLPENLFLYFFDLKRHIRRLKFILKKASDIACFDERAERVVSIANRSSAAVWQKRV